MAAAEKPKSKWVESGIQKEADTVDGNLFGWHDYSLGSSNCSFGCGCWAARFQSGGPVDPFGPCPKNPKPAAGKPKTERRMLYEECGMCGGTGLVTMEGPNQEETLFCVCALKRVVVTGLTVGQAEQMAKLDTLRQEAGISAAMLRDGRAAAFRDLLAACKAVVEQDGFHGSGLMRKRIDEMRAAIAKATGEPS